MTVQKKEIQNLHNYILRQIDKINASPEPDASKLFDLNILDSNITLLLAGIEDSSEDEEIELGTRDKQIKSALQEFRKNRKTAEGKKDLISEFSQHSTELCEQLNFIVEKLNQYSTDEENKILSENISLRFSKAIEVLKEIEDLTSQTKKIQKLWTTEKIPLTVKNAAAALGSIKSEKKASASRENGKKGGRPPKNSASNSSAKSSVKSETKSAEKKAEKTSVKSAEKKSEKISSKTEVKKSSESKAKKSSAKNTKTDKAETSSKGKKSVSKSTAKASSKGKAK